MEQAAPPPDRSFEMPTLMRRLRVAGFFIALIQRTIPSVPSG